MKKIIAVTLAALAIAGVLMANGCESLKSPLVDRSWVLTSYESPDAVVHPVVAGSKVTALFDSKTGQVTGSGGVNSYGGAFHIDHLSVTVDTITRTEMASTNPALNQQENDFFKALEKAESYAPDHDAMTIIGGGWTLHFVLETTATP